MITALWNVFCGLLLWQCQSLAWWKCDFFLLNCWKICRTEGNCLSVVWWNRSFVCKRLLKEAVAPFVLWTGEIKSCMPSLCFGSVIIYVRFFKTSPCECICFCQHTLKHLDNYITEYRGDPLPILYCTFMAQYGASLLANVHRHLQRTRPLLRWTTLPQVRKWQKIKKKALLNAPHMEGVTEKGLAPWYHSWMDLTGWINPY